MVYNRSSLFSLTSFTLRVFHSSPVPQIFGLTVRLLGRRAYSATRDHVTHTLGSHCVHLSSTDAAAVITDVVRGDTHRDQGWQVWRILGQVWEV